MIYNRLYIQVILRMCLLLLTCLALAYVFVVYKEPIALANIGALLIIQVILLVRYLNRTNRALANFFQAVKIDDSSFVRPMKLEKSYSKLWDELDKVSKTLSQVRTSLQRQNNYFQTVTEHIGTGLISYRDDGRVGVFNKAAQELLGLKNLTNIEGIRELDTGLFNTIENIEPGEKRVEKLIINGKKLQLSVSITVHKEGEKVMRLVTLQDIRNELEANELDSWQKLIRVLNHEIMNSIAPITSTINTLYDYLKNEEAASQAEAKTIKGLEIIKERSEGLREFVTRYRELTSLPKPEFEDFDIKEVVDGTVQLLDEEMLELSIEIRTRVDPIDLQLNADRHLIEQVLINLIKNAMAAEAKNIEISAFQNDKSQLVIQVKDDGTGISEEIMEEIFVPFFTTREDGMGVGLSLSRQIMRLHGGILLVAAEPDGETVFTLIF